MSDLYLTIGSFRFSPARQRLLQCQPAGCRAFRLSVVESAILTLLLSRPDMTASQEELMAAAWPRGGGRRTKLVSALDHLQTLFANASQEIMLERLPRNSCSLHLAEGIVLTTSDLSDIEARYKQAAFRHWQVSSRIRRGINVTLVALLVMFLVSWYQVYVPVRCGLSGEVTWCALASQHPEISETRGIVLEAGATHIHLDKMP